MYAVILIPSFRLQTSIRWRDDLRNKPCAVVDTDNQKSIVLECSLLAYQYGLADGMNCTQALARCPNLELVSRDLNEEKTGQAILLETSFSLTPDIEETGEGCITLDLTKVIVENYTTWAHEIIERFDSLNFKASIGIAPNPDLAYLAAKKTETFLYITKPSTFLKNLAITDIESNAKLVSLLRDWGIHSLGELTKLPMRELAVRLGPEAATLWQKASGKTMRLLKLAKQVEDYSEIHEFEFEIETIDLLHFILRRFLKSLGLRLEGVNRVAKAVELTLMLDNAPAYIRQFSIPAPTRDDKVLFRILNTHLESLTLSNAITGVKLKIEPTIPNNNQLSLFDTAIRDINKFLETLGRITAIVGDGNAGTPIISDTYKADSFTIHDPIFDKLPEQNDESYAVGLPLKRFRPPLPVQVTFAGHTPIAINCEKAYGRVVDYLGPYRALGNWWENNWNTEQWDIEIANQGLFRISRHNDQWHVEGCYGT